MHLMVLPTSSVGMTGTVCATGAPDASTMGDQDDPTNPSKTKPFQAPFLNDITINMKLNQRVRISAVKILDPILQEA